MKKVSIIVPSYNNEEYVDRCINSLLNQDYSEIEIIFVNDGSNDNTDNVVNKYVDNPKFQYIKQENGGVGAARNTGLKKATGDYITFVDSDDTVTNDYVSKMLNCALKTKADIVVCGRNKIVNESIRSNAPNNVICVDGIEALCNLLAGIYNSRPVWGKLYKREIIQGVSFTEEHIFEEVRFSTDIFIKSQKVIYMNECLYNYYIHSNSIMTSNPNRKIKDIVSAVNYVYGVLNGFRLMETCRHYFELWVVRVGMCISNLYSTNMVDKNVFVDSSKILYEIYKENGGIDGRI